ncbi:MAG: Arc family DNA-binding protein [Mariprofundales bacterium]
MVAIDNHNETIARGDSMPALTIKNIPDELYNEIKYIAKQHHRSINSEVIVCLKRILLPKTTSPEDTIKSIRNVRIQITPNIITVEDIEQSINEGRT